MEKIKEMLIGDPVRFGEGLVSYNIAGINEKKKMFRIKSWDCNMSDFIYNYIESAWVTKQWHDRMMKEREADEAEGWIFENK